MTNSYARMRKFIYLLAFGNVLHFIAVVLGYFTANTINESNIFWKEPSLSFLFFYLVLFLFDLVANGFFFSEARKHVKSSNFPYFVGGFLFLSLISRVLISLQFANYFNLLDESFLIIYFFPLSSLFFGLAVLAISKEEFFQTPFIGFLTFIAWLNILVSSLSLTFSFTETGIFMLNFYIGKALVAPIVFAVLYLVWGLELDKREKTEDLHDNSDNKLPE
ncbi:MAG: hypothetical protein ACTSYA_08475 [Candidatus Kariarchaeaceae archaeon]